MLILNNSHLSFNIQTQPSTIIIMIGYYHHMMPLCFLVISFLAVIIKKFTVNVIINFFRNVLNFQQQNLLKKEIYSHM